MKFSKTLVTLIYLALIAGTTCVQAESAGPVLGSVNGAKIYVKQVDDWVKNAVASGAKDTPDLRKSITDELVVREAILQDVKKTGLANRPEIDFKIKMAQQNTLLDLWFAEYFKSNPITEQDLKAEYERQVNLTKEGRNSNEYKLSQILVADQLEAEAIIEKLNGGYSFEKMAKEKSLDKASGAQGGSVNWALPDQLMTPIGDVALNLTKGKVAQKPVKTQIGWHVIRLDDVRKYSIPAFDDVKQTIAQTLIQRKKQEAVAQLMSKSKFTQGK